MGFESCVGPKWAATSASQGSSERRRLRNQETRGGEEGESRIGIRNSIVIGNNESWWQWPMMHNDHQTPDIDTRANLECVSSVPAQPLSPGWSVICEHFQSISIKSSWLMLEHFTAPKRRYWEVVVRHNWLTGPLTIPPGLMAWNLTHNDNGPGSHHPMVTDGQEDPPLAKLTWQLRRGRGHERWHELLLKYTGCPKKNRDSS